METADWDQCDFCVWFEELRDGRIANLSKDELEAYERHLILRHDYDP